MIKGGCIPSSSRSYVTSSPTLHQCMRSGSPSGPTATFRRTTSSANAVQFSRNLTDFN